MSSGDDSRAAGDQRARSRQGAATGRARPPDDGSTTTPAVRPGRATPGPEGAPAARKPFYARLLRLRHLHLRAWQRAVLGEGAVLVAVLMVLADVATAWTLVVLPVAVAAVVKLHDIAAGLLARPQVPRR